MTSKMFARSVLKIASPAVVLLIGVGIIVPVADSTAAEPYECIELSVSGDEGAKFTNICNEMMNLMYCVNNPQSPEGVFRRAAGDYHAGAAGFGNRAGLHISRRGDFRGDLRIPDRSGRLETGAQ